MLLLANASVKCYILKSISPINDKHGRIGVCKAWRLSFLTQNLSSEVIMNASDVDKAHDARERLLKAASILRWQESAARTVGLTSMGDDLLESITEIEAAADELHGAFVSILNQRFQHAQESSANMLRLGLAMSETRTRTNESA